VADDELKRAEANIRETPSEFLAALGRALCESEQIDPDLAEILSVQLLTATPTNDAVTKAKTAIVKLAEKRATLGGAKQ
jgi:hypothetical protein